MYGKHELCEKIQKLYPEIGECGINVAVQHDDQKKMWIVDLKKDSHELKHHLEHHDADDCMDGRQCFSLGLEISQLRKNIEGEQY